MEKEIGIDEFVAIMKAKIDEWQRDYKMNNEESPECWPLNRHEAEWDEDFGFWKE